MKITCTIQAGARPGDYDYVHVAAGGVSCALRFVNTFGFVTIPLMSFSFFLGLLGILVTKKEDVR